jgi:hypothetical protein
MRARTAYPSITSKIRSASGVVSSASAVWSVMARPCRQALTLPQRPAARAPRRSASRCRRRPGRRGAAQRQASARGRSGRTGFPRFGTQARTKGSRHHPAARRVLHAAPMPQLSALVTLGKFERRGAVKGHRSTQLLTVNARLETRAGPTMASASPVRLV